MMDCSNALSFLVQCFGVGYGFTKRKGSGRTTKILILIVRRTYPIILVLARRKILQANKPNIYHCQSQEEPNIYLHYTVRCDCVCFYLDTHTYIYICIWIYTYFFVMHPYHCNIRCTNALHTSKFSHANTYMYNRYIIYVIGRNNYKMRP